MVIIIARFLAFFQKLFIFLLPLQLLLQEEGTKRNHLPLIYCCLAPGSRWAVSSSPLASTRATPSSSCPRATPSSSRHPLHCCRRNARMALCWLVNSSSTETKRRASWSSTWQSCRESPSMICPHASGTRACNDSQDVLALFARCSGWASARSSHRSCNLADSRCRTRSRVSWL
jgi:hypothetical protein